MISMAFASLFLPFLPLLPKQILLNNFLSDIPAMGIASDNVDRNWETTPHRWDIKLIRNFMIIFGLVSTVFDVLTFGVLIYLTGTTAEVFRTGWFVESLLDRIAHSVCHTQHQTFLSEQTRAISDLEHGRSGIACADVALPAYRRNFRFRSFASSGHGRDSRDHGALCGSV